MGSGIAAQLIAMKEQYDLGIQSITQVETSVAHISEEAQIIPATVNIS